jgi:hypothetical protein
MRRMYLLVLLVALLLAPLAAQSIKVSSPNGGESWPLNSTKNITWDADGWSGFVQISIWQNGIRIGLIATGVVSSKGSFPWKIGQNGGIPTGVGSGYRIHISREYTLEKLKPRKALTDSSDGNFSITVQKMN